MRRCYEFEQESYIMEDNTPWNNNYPLHKSFTVPSPITNHKMMMHGKSSYDHHDDGMIINETRWVYDDVVKKNEHHAMGSKTILRPPLGSVHVPSHHGTGSANTILRPPRIGVLRHQYHDHDTVDYGGQRAVVTNHEAGRNGGTRIIEYYDNKGGMMHGELEALVKRIEGEGRKIERIEVIEYETKRYVPGAYYEWREFGVRPAAAPTRTDKHRYRDTPSWFNGF